MRFTVDFAALPDAVRAWFRALPEGLGEPGFFRASELLNGWVDRALFELEEEVFSAPLVRAGAAAWMKRKLERAGLVELDPWGEAARRRAPPESAAEVRAAAEAEFPSLAPSFELFELARAGFPDFVHGRRSGADILLTPVALATWQRYFSNDHRVYAVNNDVAARLAAEVAAARPGRELEVLELGAGLGSAAEKVAARVASALRRYRVSEPFPWFLAAARRKLARALPGIPWEWLSIDVNRALAEQGVAERSVDLIVAVNVLHVARDLGRALRAVAGALAPGGALVLVECVRPAPGVPIYPDFPFQLLDEFSRIDDRGEARPHGGFLTVADWRGLLARAGLKVEQEIPDHGEVSRWYSGLHLAGMVASAAG